MKNALIVFSILLVILISAAAAIYLYVSHDAGKLPPNNPDNFIKNLKADGDSKKVVICAGDSNTHGTVCINYVDILEKRLGKKNFTFINGGVNSELAYNLKQRLDTIAACRPDFITILIGSNDANGTLVEKVSLRQVKDMKLPRRSDPRWFRKNLTEICSILKEKTDAKIALLTLPPIGETINSEAYRRAAEYSVIIREVAAEQKVTLLPLNRTMDANLAQKTTQAQVMYRGDPNMVMYKGLARHYLTGKSFDKISEDNGFLYLIDLLHINTRGAETIADLIEGFISR